MADNFFSLTDLGLLSSSSQILQTWLDTMQQTYPGYQPSEASLEYVQAQILSSLAADLADQCSNGATELFRTFGTQLVGVPYQQGTAAQATITITAQASPAVIATLSAALTTGGPIVSIPVVALPFGIAAGTITTVDLVGGNPQTWTTPGAAAGDTQIPVSSQTPGFAYPVGSTISGTQQYLVDALSQFTLDTLGFTNLAAATLNAGTSQNLTLTAVQSGEIFNGAGAGGIVESIQQLDWVTGIGLQTVASGGADPEDDTHYLNRLTTALQLQAPRPIVAADFGTLAQNFVPYPGSDQQNVGRATAVDGYNPTNGTYNNARMVALSATDANGFALNNDTLFGYPNGSSVNIITTIPSPQAGWGLAGWLLSLRETNFIINIVQPTYTAIYVTVTVKAKPGWDVASVQLSIQNALLSFLTPAAWGLPSSSTTGWQNTTTVYRSAVGALVQQASGVAYIVDNTLCFGFAATPSNTADLVLPGPISLPVSSVTTVPTSGITVT